MELTEFYSDYLANLLEKLSLENKTLVLLGDLNADLLKYHTNSDISNFLGSMYSSLLSHIASPPPCTIATSATLTDNKFSNNCNTPYTYISGYLIITLYDYPAPFVLYWKTNIILLKITKKTSYTDFEEREKKQRYISEQLENIDWEV